MYIKHVPRALAAVLLLLTCAAVASAQVVPASGKVTLKQADGAAAPVQGAVVEIYRTDISGKYTTKTDKSGNYIYAGIPFGGTYTIIVSAPNARPDFMTGLRLSQQGENNFTLEPGDGRKLTLDEVKAAAGAAPAAGAAADPAAGRRAKEEMAKREAAIEAEKAKIAATNTQLNDILKAGNDALNSKNYDQAVTSYEQGIQADPEQAVFHLNKSVALRSRGVDRYNAAVKAKDTAGRDTAKADFKAAADASEKAVANLRALGAKRGAGGAGGAAGGAAAAAPPAAGAANPEELNYLFQRAENYRIALQTGSSDLADAAAKAIQEYVTVETDPAKKAKAQVSLADALLQGGQVEQSIAAYRQALTANPENLDAMYGLGIALAADPSQSKEKLTEASNALQKFAAKAPPTDPRKQEAAAAAEGIAQSLKAPAAQPAAAGKGRRPKG